MNVAIVGSRDYPNLQKVRDFVSGLPAGTTVISGGARGVDKAAEGAARSALLSLNVRVYPADWNRYGKSAGYRRNRDIVAAADVVVAFWDGRSRGTAHSVGLARQAGKPVYVVLPGDPLPIITELERE